MKRIAEATVGEAVRGFRERAHMSKAELSRRLTAAGFDTVPQTVANIEAGTRKLLLTEAVALADIFGVKVTDLAGVPDRRRRPAPDPAPDEDEAPSRRRAPKPLGYAVTSAAPHASAQAAYRHSLTLPPTRRRHVVALLPIPHAVLEREYQPEGSGRR